MGGRRVHAVLVGRKYSPITGLPRIFTFGGELFCLRLLLLRADIRLAQVDAGTGEHLPQAWQGVFQCLAYFLVGADEMCRHLLTIEAQADLDRTEVRGSDIDLGVLHITARQPQNAVGKLLRPFVVMQVSGDAGGVLRPAG